MQSAKPRPKSENIFLVFGTTDLSIVACIFCRKFQPDLPTIRASVGCSKVDSSQNRVFRKTHIEVERCFCFSKLMFLKLFNRKTSYKSEFYRPIGFKCWIKDAGWYQKRGKHASDLWLCFARGIVCRMFYNTYMKMNFQKYIHTCSRTNYEIL